MKKIMCILFLISIISAVYANSQGAITTTDFETGLTMLLPDGVTPVPDGYLFQIMLPGVDGIIDPPNSDGTPGGDDQLVTGVPGNNYYEFTMDTSWTWMPGQLYTRTAFSWPTAGLGLEPCANEGEEFYLRLYDAPTVSGATNYLNSALYLLPIGYVDLVFNTPAHWDYDGGFNWQSIIPAPTNPNAASNPTPADAATGIDITTNLSWEYTGTVTPDGYKLYLGTENPPIVEYDLGNVLTYDPGEDFDYETTYYWQIVPYTTDSRGKGRSAGRNQREAKPVASSYSRGDAEECPIWSFTTAVEPGTGSGTTSTTGATPTPIPIEPITLPAGTISGNATVTPPGNNGGAGYNVSFDIQQTPSNGGLQNPENVAYTYVITIDGAQVGDVFTFELPYVGTPSDELVWFDGISWSAVSAPQWDVSSVGFVTFSITISSVTRAGSIEVAFNDGESALPVTLTSFTATLAQETTANIQWTVESESGIVGYYVYRSETDYSQAVAISDQIHADNTPFSHSYSFIDTELEYEHTYNYWLESINFDGTTNQWGPQEITLEGAPAPQLPQVTSLEGNYPNPFNPSTMLKFSVKENEEATLTIFNSKGQQVLRENFSPGYHEYEWNADAQASGLYFYRLSSPSFNQVRKMMLLK